MKTDNPSSTGRSRFVFILVVALFVLPFVAAYWLYQRTVTGGVWGTTNHGILIQPARPLENVVLTDQDGEPYTVERFRGHWTMVFIPSDPCPEDCMKNIYYMRQIWASLGRNANRMQRVLLLENGQQKQDLSDFLTAYPETGIVVDEQMQLISQFKSVMPNKESSILLVDPLASIMMVFTRSTDPRDILKDLKKLMKASQVG